MIAANSADALLGLEVRSAVFADDFWPGNESNPAKEQEK